MIYVNAEQAYQHKKAVFHNKYPEAAKILNTRNLYEIKKAANGLPTSKEWRDKESEVMLAILAKKFDQNADPRQFLIATANCHLHEASTDMVWAIGVDLSSRPLLNGEWKGANKLGQLLEITRGEIMARHGEQAQAPLLIPDGQPNLGNDPALNRHSSSPGSHHSEVTPTPTKSTALDCQFADENYDDDHSTSSVHTYGVDLSQSAFRLKGVLEMVTERGQRRSHRSLTSSPCHDRLCIPLLWLSTSESL